MPEKNSTMESYAKMYEDTDKILGKPIIEFGLLIGRSIKPTDEVLSELNEYSKKFINETDRGTIKTILIILKPYRENPILSGTRTAIKDNYEKQFGKLV